MSDLWRCCEDGDERRNTPATRKGLLMKSLTLLIAFAGCSCVALARADDVSFLAGDAFERKLQSELRVTWQNKPLREALENLSQSQRVGIMLDRRIDPGVELDLSLRDATVESGMEAIAAELGLGVSFVGPLVYVGPTESVERLATMAMMLEDQAEALPATTRKKLLRREATVWKRLGSPRELCRELADRHGLEVRGLDRVPHDVWPEISLPPLTVIQRLTLLLGGFDLACELNPRSGVLQVIALPDQASFTKSYRVKPATLQRTLGKLRERFPEASIKTSGREQLLVAGTAAVHRAAEQLAGPGRPSSTSVTNTKRVYTFNVKNKRGTDILRYLTQQWMLTLEVAPEAEETLEKNISLSLKEASQEEVMKAILAPLKLRYEIQGARLLVMP